MNKILTWTEKYQPKNLLEVVGNEDAIRSLKDWFIHWSPKGKYKAALLHGSAGIGKTCSVQALANESNYELVEMNASDTRNKDAIIKLVGSSAKEGTLVGGAMGKRLILIDELDGITGQEDRGGVSSLLEVIAFSSVPIVCIANDAYDQKLSQLRKESKMIAFKPIEEKQIILFLDKIIKKEKLPLTSEILQFIAKNAHGDLRCAINDLQGMAMQLKDGKVGKLELIYPNRDQTKDIQQTLFELFNSSNFSQGKHAIDGLEMSYEDLLLWVFENAYHHTNNKNLADVYQILATADRFLGRITRRQSWSLLSYYFDLVSGCIAVSANNPKEVKQYTFPQKIGMYFQTKFQRALTDSISSSIAEKIHVSRRAARQESLYLVEQILNSNIGNAAFLAHWLELDDNQIKSLLQNQENFKKIGQVMLAQENERVKNQIVMHQLKHSSFNKKGEDWTPILESWNKKKEQKEVEETKRKEDEKRKKQLEKKTEKEAKKKQVKLEKNVEEEEPSENEAQKKQLSLDQFFK